MSLVSLVRRLLGWEPIVTIIPAYPCGEDSTVVYVDMGVRDSVVRGSESTVTGFYKRG